MVPRYITNSEGTLKLGTESNNAVSIGHADSTVTVNGTFAASSFSLTGTDSQSTSTGALTVSGGAGIAKDVYIGDDIFLASDASVIHFGADKNITITHETSTGLTFKNGMTGGSRPFELTTQSSESDIETNDKIGVINFQAINESTGTDANLVCAGIEAVSEGDFSAADKKNFLLRLVLVRQPQKK